MQRAGGRVRNRNVIGFVFFTRSNNPQIKETTTREGLVINDEFSFVRDRFVIDILKEFESTKAPAVQSGTSSTPGMDGLGSMDR